MRRWKRSWPKREVIETGILLAAGQGTRLRDTAPLKPLCTVAGRPLLDHAIEGFAKAGMKRAVVVLGYGAELIEAHLAARSWPLSVETVRTDDYRKSNGVSVLAARQCLYAPQALLAMCDHLVDPELYRLVVAEEPVLGARLATDRRLNNALVDIDDVTRVDVSCGRILRIGKGLPSYNGFDTGVFAIGGALFEALERLHAPSLTEGMRLLIDQDLAFAEDCGDLNWIDVDDAATLSKAEKWWGRRKCSLP